MHLQRKGAVLPLHIPFHAIEQVVEEQSRRVDRSELLEKLLPNRPG